MAVNPHLPRDPLTHRYLPERHANEAIQLPQLSISHRLQILLPVGPDTAMAHHLSPIKLPESTEGMGLDPVVQCSTFKYQSINSKPPLCKLLPRRRSTCRLEASVQDR